MTQESKTEIVIFTGLAAFLAVLWWMNRQQGGGTGLELLPIGIGGGGAVPGASTYNIPGNAGNVFNVGGTTINPSGTIGTTPPGGGSCGCPSCPSSGVFTFGSNDDLTSYLAGLNLTGAWLTAVAPGGYR